MAKGLNLTYRPKSFFVLLLIGFCVVTLPLSIALVNMGLYVDRLFVKSESAVYRAAQASMVSQSLVEQITEMERTARQYQVLSDETLLHNYENRRVQFQQTTEILSDLAEEAFLRSQLDTLKAKEEILFQYLNQEEVNLAEQFDSKQEFGGLNQLGESILQESQRWINSQVQVLAAMADKAERLLNWQVAVLVPGTIVFAIFLSTMIYRPIHQIDDAIRGLGNGKLDHDIKVRGPKDLQSLGERLNWLRHRLVELEEKKGQFMRHVSHELKTPLTAIREGSALMAEGVLGQLNKQQTEVARVLQRNSLLLQKMIENLLNFNMVQAKKATLDVGDVRLDQVIEDVAADHKLALLAKRIDLQLNCRELHIHGDREKLRVVVDNLVSNAIKYSPEQGRLTVDLSQVEHRVVLDVVDSGPGIASEDAQQVFEAFYRGNSTPNSDIRGSGLGLSIAMEFVQFHHGSIEVVQDGQQGAHFRVTLPAHLDKVAA